MANGEDTGVGLASVADVGDEATKVHATNFSLMIRRAMTRAILFTAEVRFEAGTNLEERCRQDIDAIR